MAAAQPRTGDNNRAEGTVGRNSMFVALMLTVGLMVYEIIGGWASGSLALLAAAGLLLATGSAITISVFSSWAESRPASIERTFGYHRVEVVGSMLGRTGPLAGSRMGAFRVQLAAYRTVPSWISTAG